jgi:hypothetical protein
MQKRGREGERERGRETKAKLFLLLLKSASVYFLWQILLTGKVYILDAGFKILFEHSKGSGLAEKCCRWKSQGDHVGLKCANCANIFF